MEENTEEIGSCSKLCKIGMNGVRADYRFERIMKVQEIKIINKERRNNKKEELTGSHIDEIILKSLYNKHQLHQKFTISLLEENLNVS
jgi:hypothetical protein